MVDHSCMIIAHRGESFEAPENTMAAINLAWELGAGAVEIDVQLSKDYEVVVIHDENTSRVADVNKKVKGQTLAELKKLDVGLWMDIQWKDERIPTLMEVLDSVPDEKKLIIEIKCGHTIIPFIESILEKTDVAPEQIEFIGFSLKTMAITKQKFPKHKVLWLHFMDYYWINRIFKPSVKKAIKKARKYNLDGLNVWAGDMFDRNLVDKIKTSKLLIYTWTINDIEMAQRLVDWGVDAITTDRAHWLSSHLALPS